MERIKSLRWKHGGVLPANIKVHIPQIMRIENGSFKEVENISVTTPKNM